jgi:hypothetical protein
MSVRRSLVVGLGLAVAAPFVAPTGAGAAAPPTPAATVSKAQTWLLSKQQADGGFEVSGFPGFETPDAVLALAAPPQNGAAWSRSAARSAVESFQTAGGKDALDAIDDLVETGDTTTQAKAVQAAKVIALVATPLGIDPHDFDPSNDSADPVDLVARVQHHVKEDGTLDVAAYFNGELYTAIGFTAAGVTVPSGLLGQIEAAQRSDGSWNFAGNQDPGTDGDVDTTAVALVALKSLHRTKASTSVAKGISFLASQQQADGAWQAFGSDDPNSTSSAVLGLSAVHVDVTTAAWRASAGSPVSGTYASPYTWLESQQAADGHIASSNDAFPPVNTFATTQTLQALSRQWFLAHDHELLADDLSEILGSPAGSPNHAAADTAGAALGNDASIAKARLSAARAVLSSALGRQAAAADLFQQALGRAIDPSGRAYWSKKLITITRPQMLSRITGSSEFYRHAGGTTAKFVDAVYQSVLGRAADAGGRAYWIRKIDGGDSVQHVAQSLVASTEYRRKTVDAAYQRVLGRNADPSGRSYWTTKLATTRAEVLLSSLASTDELYTRATTEI